LEKTTKEDFVEKRFEFKLAAVIAGLVILLFVVGLFVANTPSGTGPEFISKPIQKFSNYSELAAYFEKANNYDGYKGGMYRDLVNAAMPVMADAAVGASGEKSSSSATDFSKTNIQVEGVDEADIIKNDGKYIYAISNSKLFIVDAYPATDAKIISTIEVDNAYPSEMFISSDSEELLLFSTKGYSGGGYYTKSIAMPGYYPYYRGSGTIVQLFDISDKTNPKSVKKLEFDGSYLTSRMVNDVAYYVINSYPNIYYANSGSSSGTDENNIIPLMKVDGSSQRIADPIEIGIMPLVRPQSFVTIASINLKTKKTTKETVVGSAQNIYASTDNIYLVDSVWEYTQIDDTNSIIPAEIGILIKSIYFPEWNNTQKTAINKFHFDEGKISFAGAAIVPGNILNQFSMDEYKNNFRIATTVENYGSFEIGTATSNRSTSNVYVLDNDMKVVGSIEGIAPDEKIYSVRFMGDKGYMVTFKYVDPLFVMDLSDPTNPKILGKLKIPGYSDYLHPIDETHLLGIGKDANELEDAEKVHSQGAIYYTAIKGIKMAIFDVSDVSNPKEVAKYVVGDRGTESEALTNHKAILFDKEKELLVFPITIVENKTANTDYYGTEQSFQGALVMNVSLTDGFSERGRITHVSNEEEMKRGYYYDSTSIIRRSLFMDDVLYTVSDKMIKTNNLNDLTPISEVNFPASQNQQPEQPIMID